jgi:hypothetical protein
MDQRVRNGQLQSEQNFLNRDAWKKVLRHQVTRVMMRKLISTKWIFKKKIEQDGSIRYKARIVSKGFMF